MTDDEVASLLRSESPIVLIEAPAGCGKTYQAASYAAEVASKLESGKLLVLTHTHAACSVIAERTQKYRTKIDIRTLDSLISQIAAAYRLSLGIEEDIYLWTKQNGYELLASKVTKLIGVNPIIAKKLVALFPVIICDEHQDSNEAQNEFVQLLYKQGALLRVFGDPMQIIPGGHKHQAIITQSLNRWNSLKSIAKYGELSTPHRWSKSNIELGKWILNVRQSLKNGHPIDLKNNLPPGLNIIIAENKSLNPTTYVLAPSNWDSLNSLLEKKGRMLLVASSNNTVQSLRGTFRPRFSIWEGHTRNNLEKFIQILAVKDGSLKEKNLAFLEFLKSVIVGFTDAAYGKRLIKEVESLTESPKGNIPPHLKIMATFIRSETTHVGFSKAAEYLRNLILQKSIGFADLHLDYLREFEDLIKLKDFEDPVSGFAAVSHRRSRAHPKPPSKALSTIHKAKGLEAAHVIIFACDDKHFQMTNMKRNLLYVALSRATDTLTIAVSKTKRSKLVIF